VRVTGKPAVLLTDAAAHLVRVVPAASSVEDFRADLPGLKTG
jgi:hypothetical protein